MSLPHMPHRQRTGRLTAFPVIVIGASTGGPPVIDGILKALHQKNLSGAALLIVQHMPGEFTLRMAERLERAHPELHIREAQDGDTVLPGIVLIAPGDHHMRIEADHHGNAYVRLTNEAVPQDLRPSIDITMQSVAETFGPKALGILLSGMGQDGARGMQYIRACGGETIVQDPATCVVDSMVQYAIGCDGAGIILKPERIPDTILSIVSSRTPHDGHL